MDLSLDVMDLQYVNVTPLPMFFKMMQWRNAARHCAELRVGGTCRGWKIKDEDVRITEVYRPGRMDSDKHAEIICHISDGCVTIRQEWCEQLQCHVSWALDAAGNLDIIEVIYLLIFWNILSTLNLLE